MTPIDALPTLAPHAGQSALGLLTLADALILMSFWKPILVLLPFVGWGWVISSIYDKHAHRFHLGRKQWNMVHLIAGLVAVLVFFAIPMKGEIAFWIALLAMMGVLLGDLIAFPVVANRDDRVPEAHRLRFDLSSMQDARAAKAAAKLAGKAELVLTGPGKRKLEVPDAETPEFETRVLAESLYIKGREARASLVEVLPSGKPDGTYGVVYLVDGVRQAGDVFPGPQALSIMDVWKSAGGLDVADRRRKMLGDVSVEYAGVKKTVRVLSQGTQGVMRLTLTFDPAESVRRAIDDLGLLDPQIEAVKRLAADGTGVVLSAGQTRGGRTTTLYALTRLHDAYTSNVQTLELEVQDAIEGSKQNVFDPQNTEAEFSKTIRSILRRDPDVVAVAEVPDQQTAQEISKADHTRTRIYVSLRQSSALSTLQGWTKAVGDADLATAGLRGVVAQRLIRRLCTNCRVPYQPTPEMLKQLGLPADKVKQLFKKGGQVLIKNKPELCPVCNGGGYIGQEGLFEVYEITDAIRDMIRGGRWNDVKAEFRKTGLPSINQVALRKAVDGVTSVEEIARISQEGAAKAGAGA